MLNRDALSLIIVPFFLLLFAVSLAFRYEAIVLNDEDEIIEKYTILVNGIESGNISPSSEQLVSFLKSHRDLVESRKDYDNSIAEILSDIIQILLAAGLLQLMVVYFYMRKKHDGSSKNTI